jgi:Uma2 family endonuclease
MRAEATLLIGDQIPTADQRLVTYGVPWSHFEAQLALRGDAPVPRMAYLDGALEQMSPSKEHERIKSYLGRLVDTYALERGIDLSPYGAWTLRSAPFASGIEPDECFLVGDQDKDVPDLAIEIAWTSGGIDKLEIYRRLGVREVWIWRRARLEGFVLDAGGFESAAISTVLPGLELDRLVAFLEYPTALQAVRAFRDELRGVDP